MFKNKDVICLLGDSITASGLWGAEAYQTIGADTDVKIFNCGVSGGTADRALKYLYHYCLNKNPDYVTVMFGVNDIDRGCLSASYTGEDAKERVARAVARHAEKTECIINTIIEYGATPILCTAPPYDEYNESAAENLFCDYALDECAENVRALAKKYNCTLVDFRAEMLDVIKELKPIGADRIHPNPKGYHIMAQIFLHSLGIIEKKDYETSFVLEEWNAKRREVEIQLKRLDYIDYNRFFDKSQELGWGTHEKITACREILANPNETMSFIRECSEIYIENANKRNELIDELVRLTIYPRSCKQ